MLIIFHGNSYYRRLLVYDQTEEFLEKFYQVREDSIKELLNEGRLYLGYFIEKLNEVFSIYIDIPDDLTAAYWDLKFNSIDKIITLLPDIFCKQPVLRIELGDLYRQVYI